MSDDKQQPVAWMTADFIQPWLDKSDGLMFCDVPVQQLDKPQLIAALASQREHYEKLLEINSRQFPRPW